MTKLYYLIISHVELPAPKAAAILAEVLERNLYDARQAVSGSANGPVIVGTYAGNGDAARLLGALAQQGIRAFILNDDDVQGPAERFLARRIELTRQALIVHSRAGESITMPYFDIVLLIKGMGITDYPSTEVRSRRRLSLGMAVVTGGLKMTKKVTTTHTKATHKRAQFLYVYGTGQPTIALHEDELVYDGLGDLMKASRILNFNFVVEKLRRADDSVFDDRLMNRGAQARLLGPKFAPEANLDLATSVLANALLS